MSEPDGIERRVDALENAVDDLGGRVRRTGDRLERAEGDAAAARLLAGGADRDVADLRTEMREFREQNTRLHNATREDLTDLRQHVDAGFAVIDDRFAEIGARFAQIDRNFAQIDRNFAQVDRNFAEVNRGFLGVRGVLDGVAAGQQQIGDHLQRLTDEQAQIRATLRRIVPPDGS